MYVCFEPNLLNIPELTPLILFFCTTPRLFIPLIFLNEPEPPDPGLALPTIALGFSTNNPLLNV